MRLLKPGFVSHNSMVAKICEVLESVEELNYYESSVNFFCHTGVLSGKLLESLMTNDRQFVEDFSEPLPEDFPTEIEAAHKRLDLMFK